VELNEALRRRRMTRSFSGAPIDRDALDAMCAEALRAPTAGNSAGVSMRTAGADQVAGYLEVATDASWRERATRAADLARAGALVVVLSDPSAYAARYREADKANSGLGDPVAWTVPYWHADAAMATMALLLLVEQAGWGACLWGNFRHERAVLDWAGASAHEALFATVLIGEPDDADRRSRSLERQVPRRTERVRRVGGQ
jgi:nitroreductase